MSGFATHRQRVHDVRLTPRARHANLRTCVVMFAPYGFRATYHHLCVSAGVPGDLAADPLSLVRAVEELGAARQLWLADEPSSACPACDGRVGTTRWFTGHEEHDLCARCGITLGARPAGPDARVARERHERWLAVWWRTG